MYTSDMIEELGHLYERPMPSTRGGPFFSAFSYPTKISPEAIAIYVATHTKPGDTVLDLFAGSGTTGLAALLCERPTCDMLDLAKAMGVSPEWGARNAVLVELGVLGAFVAQTLCNPPDPTSFLAHANQLLDEVETELAGLYDSTGPNGQPGTVRHTIWSDVLLCPACKQEVTFWDSAVELMPAKIGEVFVCPNCHHEADFSQVSKVYERVRDPLIGSTVERRKRFPARIHGESAGKKWQRPGTQQDLEADKRLERFHYAKSVPVVPIPWGDLYRAGYHRGLTHAHHFYTHRNLVAFSHLWQKVESKPAPIRDALKFLLLSYNATHGTIMTRVVAKSGQNDLVLTGAQSGVLYVSSLPVEKNFFIGLRRKATAIAKAFTAVPRSTAKVRVIHGSSTKIDLPDSSVDYVFTDPPFGDYIPYAELNFLNEVWLGTQTDTAEEVIISSSQGKGVSEYTDLMEAVFQEAHRVMKPRAQATVVFHSAKADVWSSLQRAYMQCGFAVRRTGLLDKIQGSFKQVTAAGSVKGDPLLLLEKGGIFTHASVSDACPDLMLQEVLAMAVATGDRRELTVDRMFSRYVSQCLAQGVFVTEDAPQFYCRAQTLLGDV